MPRRRRLFVHLVVNNLTVNTPWRVGRATLLPAGRLLDHLEADFARRDPAPPDVLKEQYRRGLVDRPWATIRVPVLVSGDRIDDATTEGAREVARDVIAVLRLFQRTRHRQVNFDHQTFGLATDIGSVVEQRWITDTHGRFGGGWQVHGIMAPWTFKTADMRAYRADPRFVYLDAALAVADEDRDDWQRRVLACARTLNLATVMVRPATRIVLLATAYEALLGNTYKKGDRTTGAHGLAQRAAYLACGKDVEPSKPHGIGERLACRFLTATADPARDASLLDRASGRWACSWYGEMRDLSDDRNATVHGADLPFGHRRASTHELHLDRVFLQTLDWVVRTQPSGMGDLDNEIRSLPAEPEPAA